MADLKEKIVLVTGAAGAIGAAVAAAIKRAPAARRLPPIWPRARASMRRST